MTISHYKLTHHVNLIPILSKKIGKSQKIAIEENHKS